MTKIFRTRPILYMTSSCSAERKLKIKRLKFQLLTSAYTAGLHLHTEAPKRLLFGLESANEQYQIDGPMVEWGYCSENPDVQKCYMTFRSLWCIKSIAEIMPRYGVCREFFVVTYIEFFLPGFDKIGITLTDTWVHRNLFRIYSQIKIKCNLTFPEICRRAIPHGG